MEYKKEEQDVQSHEENLISLISIPVDGRYTYINEKGQTVTGNYKAGDLIKVRVFAKKT
jgi:hypothetical protein